MTENSNGPTRGSSAFKPSAGIAAAVTVIGGTLVIGGQPVSAASFVVTNTNASGIGSLAEAIDLANADSVRDVITFDPSVIGSIDIGATSLEVKYDVDIIGPGSATLTITNSAGDLIYLYNTVATNATISGLTLDDAAGDAIAVREGGDLAFSDLRISAANSVGIDVDGGDPSSVTITDVTVDLSGGDGIELYGVRTVVIDGATVTNSSSLGIDVGDVDGVTISNSTVTESGGRGIEIYPLYGDASITDTVVTGSGDDGIYFDGSSNEESTVTIERVEVADSDSHGMYLRGESKFVLRDVSISDSGEKGLYVSDDSAGVTLERVQVARSSDSGIYIEEVAYGGSVSISEVTVSDSGDWGLVINGVEGDLVVSDTSVTNSGNDGLYVDGVDGSVTIERVTVADSGDEALEIDAVGGDVTVVNSTFTGAGDTATEPSIEVGVIGGTFTVAHSTISGNGIAGTTAPVIQTVDQAVNVDHTIITANNGAAVFAASGTGTATVTNSLTPVGSGLGASNVESNDPLLGPLGNFGGLTETLRPLLGSPAIDAGDPAIVGAPATDQRGGARQVGTIDIGAVEVAGGSVSVADVTVAEGAGSASVTVTRSGGSDGAASVRVVTASGTALAGVDFTSVDQVVTWADGESGAKSVPVPILDDLRPEVAESFAVALSVPSVVSIVDGSATVTITDDDAPAVSSLAPQRFVDTRAAGATFDDRFEAEGKRTRGSEYRVQIAGRGGVPVDAEAVVVNVTAVAPEAKGFVTVHPCVTPLPLASSLNYEAGVNLANEIVAPLSASGELCIFTSEAAHIVVDVVGFVDAASPTEPLTPARFLDTRASGATFDQVSQRGGRTGAGGQVTLKVTGRGGVPADAVAVIANVTAVNPDGKGFVTVHPCAAIPPNASSLNYVNGVNRANELIASVNASGEICLFTSTATDLVVDVVGYVPAGTSFSAIAPSRFLDTRASGVTVDGVAQAGGKRGAGSQLELQVAGRPGVPAGVSAVVVNVTAVAPEATGFVTVHPCEATRPLASSLNYVAGVDGANELIARLDATGKICLFTDQSAHLVVDVVGYLD